MLDEATSALDSKTEAKIQAGLETLGDKTFIIIAHRLSTLKNTDQIYVFDAGTIVEQGTFAKLAEAEDSRFYQLYRLQQGTRRG